MFKLDKRLIIFSKIFAYILLFILIIIVGLFLLRRFSHSEIDDVTPGIPCEQEYISKSDVLWVIPIFENKSIADNLLWCNEIKSLNKTLGMHGVHHTFNEFNYDRDVNYVLEGISAFKACFGYFPQVFKSPQLKLNNYNRILLKSLGFKVDEYFNQITHKVYHCSDSGGFYSNRFNDLI